ncbi:sigma factor-like helix-turn-helix DNA-binding protein [Streptomyces sp. NRRL F-525]|uniref:sigma factor-like helix-turn-helix DNA-binding protein n=1 Tax=Streptomyces sp. NRRL F-525 TaxID=1463861 RepID=UPI00052564A3|nr:sigma factor-like helix-turn-helix DNA-binding protein [Streptomyces sp. NRRL F-525]
MNGGRVARGAAEEEFDEFYALAYPRLVRQLCAMTGDLPEAQDVVQEAWIRTTAWRLAVSGFRRVRRGVQLMQRHHEQRSVEGPSPERVALVDALRTLPQKHRSVVVLHHLCDLSVEQISAETGWPAGSIRVWLVRGRLSLARHFSSLPDQEVDHVG